MESPQKILRQEWLHIRDRLRVWVSTVWVGDELEIDQRPWIFETMVFEGVAFWYDVRARPGYGDDLEQWRYATIEEALAGHEMAIEATRLYG
jgi:hypothetical protein